MATDTKEETKQTNDLEFLDEVNYSNDRRGHSQTGRSMGEFGPDYSHRKQYHIDYHTNPEHPEHTPHGKPLYWSEPIKRSRTEPLTKEEIDYRHEELKREYHQRKRSPYPDHVLDRWTDQPITDQEYKRIEKKYLDPDIGPDQLKDESA